MLSLVIQTGECLVIKNDILKLRLKVWVIIAILKTYFGNWLVGLFSVLDLLCTHIFNIIHLWFQRKADSGGACPACPGHHTQIIAQTWWTSINSCQICSNVILRITRRSCKHFIVQISRKEMITRHEMWQSLQPHHCIVWQWCFYPIHKICKKWEMTLSPSMAMYSVMHDIHDARRVPMERGWVALYLYATCEYSN